MKNIEYIKNRLIIDNFLVNLASLPSFIKIDMLLENVKKGKIEEIYANQRFYSSKRQQVMEFTISFVEDIQEINSRFVYNRENESLKHCELNIIDLDGISWNMNILFLNNNVVKVKKEYMNKDYEREKEEQYYKDGKIISSRLREINQFNEACLAKEFYSFQGKVLCKDLKKDKKYIIYNYYGFWVPDYTIPRDKKGVHVFPIENHKNQFHKQCTEIYSRVRRLGSEKSSPK